MNEINIYCLSLFESDYKNIIDKNYIPVGLGNDNFVKGWLTDLGYEDVSQYSTHSMRKSKASLIYEKTKNVDAVRRLLGQSSVTATSAYLGVTDNSALDLARQYSI